MLSTPLELTKWYVWPLLAAVSHAHWRAIEQPPKKQQCCGCDTALGMVRLTYEMVGCGCCSLPVKTLTITKAVCRRTNTAERRLMLCEDIDKGSELATCPSFGLVDGLLPLWTAFCL